MSWDEEYDDAEPAPEHHYTAYGAVRQLYRFRKWPRGHYECLLEGPAGTGKTRGLLEWVYYMWETFPGIRILFLRKTKESLSESVLVTWEDEVLPPGHPCIAKKRSRNHRQHYEHPNGSHIVLGGLADKRQAEKTFSTQYDIIVVFESREIPELTMWQWLARANRNFKIPWQIRIADTNPGTTFHWLNQYFPKPDTGGAYRTIPKSMRQQPPFYLTCDEGHSHMAPKPRELEVSEDGKIVLHCPTCGGPAQGSTRFRLLSRFQDNPVWYDHEKKVWTPDGLSYVEGNLALLTGAPRANLYEGRWAAEEGVILEEWDEAVHMIEPRPLGSYDWFFGSFDKGMRHPASFGVWGVRHRKGGDEMTLLREHYRTNWNGDQWAEIILEENKRTPLQALPVDPSEPDFIQTMNQRMGEKRGRDGEWIARKANNSILTGIDQLRWALSKRDGGPRFFVEKGYLMGRDPVRVAKMKAACLTDEIVSWVWAKNEEGKRAMEVPDPTCADHSMDMARYGAMFLWANDLRQHPHEEELPGDSFGAVMGHLQAMGMP